MIKAENDRVNVVLKSRLQEIQAWKKKANELQNGTIRAALVEKDKKALQDKCSHNARQIEEMKFAIKKLEDEKSHLIHLERDLEEINSKNDGLHRQINRLNTIIRNIGNELGELKLRNQKAEGALLESKRIEETVKNYQHKLTLSEEEIERLNKLIAVKNEDIDQLEKEKVEMLSEMNYYKNYENQIREYEQDIEKMRNVIDTNRKEIENWQNKFRASDGKVRELENALFVQNQEKEKLGTVARNKSNEN